MIYPLAPIIMKEKQKTWEVFSKYIRLRDCLKTTKSLEFGKCCTCGVTRPFNELQAGHFIDGRNNYLLFNEDFTNVQCISCNMFKDGNKEAYRVLLVNKLGLHKVKEFEDNHSQISLIEDYELKELRKTYSIKIKELKSSIM